MYNGSILTLLLNIVGIKILFDAVGTSAAYVCVIAAQLELVLLMNFNEKYTKCLLLIIFLLKDMNQDSAHIVAASKVLMLKPGVTTVIPITIIEEKAQRRLEVKGRSTLILGIPNEHQLKFNSIKDDNQLLEAVEKRFGGNAATKNTQRNLLKQQYENSTASSSEMLDKTFDRLQKLVSQLELLDEKISYKNVNRNLLRSLSPEWNTHTVVWRNKAYLDKMSMDDLYNNLKVYELEVKGMSSSSLSTQNMAFVSSLNNSSSSTNGVVNTTQAVKTAQAVNTANEFSTASTQVNAAYSTNIDNLSDAVIYSTVNQIIVDNCKKGLGYENYNAVPPPYIGNFIPPTPDLSFTGLDEFFNKPVVENCKAKSSEEETKVVRKNDDALIIKEWVSNNEEENVSQPKIEKKAVRPSIAKIEFVKPKQQKKTARKTVKQVEQHRQNTYIPRGNQRN
nr:hypothetical protein [Tanacetum cinerariifolium]